jgi:translation initiation factor eIF-2B subunit delta
MGTILNLAYGIHAIPGTATIKDVLHYLHAFENNIIKHMEIIANYFKNKNLSGDAIMVYSSSSTVEASLEYAWRNGSRFKVIALESRPMNEGKNMMLNLSKASIPVIYTTDAAGMSMLASGRADRVLLGGDAIHPEGFVCKSGSRAIAVLCKTKKVPLYGLCGSEKIIPPFYKSRFLIRDMPAKEVTRITGRRVTVINRYFEIVPFHLFTEIITDKKPFLTGN